LFYLLGDTNALIGVAFSPDGSTILSTSRDHTVRARRRAAAARLARALLELVALARERGERSLEEVVCPGGGERPREDAPGTRGEDLSRRQTGRRPRADAAAARHELADGLLEVAGLLRLLVVPAVRLAFDERRAEEARHLV